MCYECEPPPQLCTLMESFPGINIIVALLHVIERRKSSLLECKSENISWSWRRFMRWKNWIERTVHNWTYRGWFLFRSLNHLLYNIIQGTFSRDNSGCPYQRLECFVLTISDTRMWTRFCVREWVLTSCEDFREFLHSHICFLQSCCQIRSMKGNVWERENNLLV